MKSGAENPNPAFLAIVSADPRSGEQAAADLKDPVCFYPITISEVCLLFS